MPIEYFSEHDMGILMSEEDWRVYKERKGV